MHKLEALSFNWMPILSLAPCLKKRNKLKQSIIVNKESKGVM